MMMFLIAFLFFQSSENQITVEHQWARAAEKGMNSGIFMNIKNNTDLPDTLVSAESEAAEVTEVHETYDAGSGMMGMRKAGKLGIKSGNELILKPGSYHIMLIGLKKDLVKGESVKINLVFSKSGKIEITCPIKVLNPKMMKMKS